ncbi:MAG: bifunctional phosphoribosyl-AMP cyclohydrolase/phosphoribosyl-ATP diphosphatase HisIE [Candidatus Atribacteria bacterium]|nr:bifunctional phosphoribosyl-AMP cyclohydrolase/phosphoribosyl-ATP diphosphatase HisIE [Candidatus Atribacteria bacterium]
MTLFDHITFNEQGLIPTIIQDATSGKVLMMAYMNREAIQKTCETGETWFFSRKRQTLWHKGETSGHFQTVKHLYLDCDNDTLLIMVDQKGVACHIGLPSCFHREVKDGELSAPDSSCPPFALSSFLQSLFEIIDERAEHPSSESYTTRLFEAGREKILRKIAEESTEVLLAATETRPDKKEHLRWEAADLLYHLLVLLRHEGLTFSDVMQELEKRRK